MNVSGDATQNALVLARSLNFYFEFFDTNHSMQSASSRSSSFRRLHGALYRLVEDLALARASGVPLVGGNVEGKFGASASTWSRAVSSTTTSSSSTSGPPPSYVACVALERLPMLAPLPPAYEEAYKGWSAEWNARRFKSLPDSFVVTEAGGAGGGGDRDRDRDRDRDPDGRVGGSQVAGWVAAPRETSADRAKDTRSLNRRLDARLFLLVKRGGTWGFVEGAFGDVGSSRGAAEAALAGVLGSKPKGDGGDEAGVEVEEAVVHYFVGNAPAAHTVGEDATRFYHRCQLVQPGGFDGVALMRRGGYEDYAWVTVDEMGAYLGDAARVATLQAMA